MAKKFSELARAAGEDVNGLFEDGIHWVTAPWRTESLRERLENTRDGLRKVSLEFADLLTDRSEVVNQLSTMEAKTSFLAALSTEIVEIAPPPEPEGQEEAYLQRVEEFYEPLEIIRSVAGAAGLALLLPVGAARGIKFLSMGKLFKNAGTSTKLSKLMKAGKGSLYLSAAIYIFETAIKLIDANEVNKYLKEKEAELTENLDNAEREIVKVEVQIDEATERRDKMLREAGADDVADYLVKINEAISEVAAQATLVKIARNLVGMGKATDEVATMTGLDAETVGRIAQRLAAEKALLKEGTVESVATETGLSGYRVRVIKLVLAVRGDAALGYDDDQLVARHKVSDAVADMQIDLVEDALEQHWDAIHGDGELAAISTATLLPLDALAALRAQIAAKAALWAGQDVASVAEAFPAVPHSRLEELAEGLDEERDMVAKGHREPHDYAVLLRLPPTALAT